MTSEKTRNRLAFEKSPYLLQHAGNPVDWYPWGADAFEKAKRENKPIFLSIGYSTCHWCHVMAHESFEDSTIARLMNDVFVSVKVDREERPDIDMLYMTVCQMMTGSGGWPLTIIMTPDTTAILCRHLYSKRNKVRTNRVDRPYTAHQGTMGNTAGRSHKFSESNHCDFAKSIASGTWRRTG